MNAELTTHHAEQIRNFHESAEQLAIQAKDVAGQALDAAVSCGLHLAEVKGMTKGGFLAWLRDNVPELTQERAKAYLSLFATNPERAQQAIDHRQLLLLGVIEQGEASGTERTPATIDAGRWIGWVGNIRGWWTKTTRERPVEQWSDEERQAVRDQLRPIVELYEQVGGYDYDD